MPNFSKSFQNFSAGELGPGSVGRDDRDFYERGLKDATNIVPLPSGGFTARGGFRHLDYVRNRLVAVDLSTATVTGGGAGGTAPTIEVDDDYVIVNGGEIP